MNLYGYVENNPVNALDALGLRSGDYNLKMEAGEAGAKADLLAASRNKLIHGAIEYSGYICQVKCSAAPKFYFTGPTKGRPGSGGNAPSATTSTHTQDLERCQGDDPIVGFHYAHPDGTPIPAHDQMISRLDNRPFILAFPDTRGNVHIVTYGWR